MKASAQLILVDMELSRQMAIISGYLRNQGLEGVKLTLVVRDPSDPERYIVKTDDVLDQAIATILQAKKRETA